MNPCPLKEYLLCIQRLVPLGDGDLERAFGDWMAGDERARRLIEEQHLSRVVAWVLPYRGQGIAFMALIEAGNRALLKALRRHPDLRLAGFEDHLRTAVEESVESLLMARRP